MKKNLFLTIALFVVGSAAFAQNSSHSEASSSSSTNENGSTSHVSTSVSGDGTATATATTPDGTIVSRNGEPSDTFDNETPQIVNNNYEVTQELIKRLRGSVIITHSVTSGRTKK